MSHPDTQAIGMPLRAWIGTVLVAAFCLACPAGAARADVLRILQDDQEALQARVDLIQQARCEIDAAYFSVEDDHLALALLALLRDASRRGVRVRLLVDGMYNDVPNSVQIHLLHEGVEVREYHPIECQRPFWINRRMHDKALIVDGCHMIVGSRNLDYRNFGLAERNYVDRDAYLRGNIAAEVRRYFQCLWSSDEVRPTNTRKRDRPQKNDCHPMRRLSRQLHAGAIHPEVALDQALCDVVARGCLQTNSGPLKADWAAGWPELDRVCFLSDHCGEKRQPCAISDEILELVANARHSIILESPYLFVSRDLDDALAQAQCRGVHVVILTNSLATTDQMMVYAGYSNQKKKLLARGIELWEFAGPDHFHAKAALIDGCISVIGSYNFDPRSEHLNTETAVVTCHPSVAADLSASMAKHFANAWRIGADGRPIGASSRHPGADDSKIRQLRATRLVAPLIQRHL